MAGQVFVSYARADERYVVNLAAHLRRRGVSVWTDAAIPFSSEWPQVIQGHIDSCAAFIVVMSPASRESSWVRREVLRALTAGKRIFPLLLSGEAFFEVSELEYEDVQGEGMPSPGWVDQLSAAAADPNGGVAWTPRPTAAEELVRKQEERARILDAPGVIRTLRALYPTYPLVELWGVPFPICEFPARPDEWTDVEAAVGRLLDRRVPAWDEYADGEFDPAGRPAFENYVARFNQADPDDRKRFFPGPTYALRQIRPDGAGHLRVDCVMGRYFASLATSEELDREMMECLAAAPDTPVALSALPRRSWLHEQVADVVVDGRHRSGAVSHATVILTATGEGDGGYDILLPLRSTDVATHSLFNHVAPSGIFAPFNEDSPSPTREFSVRRNFYREWVEELYAADEHERPAYSFGIPDPAVEPEVSRLEDLLDRGDAQLHYTGLSVNLLMMRPEICLLLLIDDPDWLARESRVARETGRRLKLGWEYEQGPSAGRRIRGQPDHFRFHLGPDLRPWDSSRLLKPSFLIPNAAAAISLALTLLRARPGPGGVPGAE